MGAACLNFAVLVRQEPPHAELFRTSRALSPPSLASSVMADARLDCVRATASLRPSSRRSAARTDGERDAMFNGRRTKRGATGRDEWRAPKQIAADRAVAHAVALHWREAMRSEATVEPRAAVYEARSVPVQRVAPAAVVPTPEQRARFAAAIARAEFGRFYPAAERPATGGDKSRTGRAAQVSRTSTVPAGSKA